MYNFSWKKYIYIYFGGLPQGKAQNVEENPSKTFFATNSPAGNQSNGGNAQHYFIQVNFNFTKSVRSKDEK